MIRKFDSRTGETVEFDSDRQPLPGSVEPVEMRVLQSRPEQKYEGEWTPGTNQPELPPLTTGPYAGIIRYLPIPESQIER